VTAPRARIAALLGLAAAAACAPPRARTCAGEPVASFQFGGEVIPDDAGCPFAPDAGLSRFSATVTFGSGADAFLCIDRSDAEPLRGTHVGDHVVLSSDAGPANVATCSCDVLVTERVEGDLLRADGGAVVGFSGELKDHLEAADAGASCERDAGTPGAQGCGVPCDLRWQLTGS
jgi:hypothetical protein